MSLALALDTATKLRDALAAEVEAARGERRLLRTLDSAALLDRATARATFLAESRRLEGELARELGRAAPAGGGPLADVLGEIRALAGALSEIDRLNLALASRALACVRGYVEAVAPAPNAYDRRGARAASAAPALAVVSARG
jgi:hypothetical protein